MYSSIKPVYSTLTLTSDLSHFSRGFMDETVSTFPLVDLRGQTWSLLAGFDGFWENCRVGF